MCGPSRLPSFRLGVLAPQRDWPTIRVLDIRPGSSRDTWGALFTGETSLLEAGGTHQGARIISIQPDLVRMSFDGSERSFRVQDAPLECGGVLSVGGEPSVLFQGLPGSFKVGDRAAHSLVVEISLDAVVLEVGSQRVTISCR